MKSIQLMALYLFLSPLYAVGMENLQNLNGSPVLNSRAPNNQETVSPSGSPMMAGQDVNVSPISSRRELGSSSESKQKKKPKIDAAINARIKKESKRVTEEVQEQAVIAFRLDMLTLNAHLRDSKANTMNPALINAIQVKLANAPTASSKIYPADLIDDLTCNYNYDLSNLIEKVTTPGCGLRCTPANIEASIIQTIEDETTDIENEGVKNIVQQRIKNLMHQGPLHFAQYAATKFVNDYIKKSV